MIYLPAILADDFQPDLPWTSGFFLLALRAETPPLVWPAAMVGGCALLGSIMNGVGTALAEISSNFMQNAFGLAVGFALYKAFPEFEDSRSEINEVRHGLS